MTASGERLIAEALAKSGVIWLTSAMGSGPVWYVALNDVAYVVTGPGEQACPAHEGPTQIVTRSKETRARLLSYLADATVLTPEAEDWDAAVAALVAGRLNAPAGDVEARWRENNTVLRFTPDTSSVIVRGEEVTAHERHVEPETPPEAEVIPPVTTEPATTPGALASKSPTHRSPESRGEGPMRPTAKPTPKESRATRPETVAPTRSRKAPEPAAGARIRPKDVGDEPTIGKNPARGTAPRGTDTQPIPVRPRKRTSAPTGDESHKTSPVSGAVGMPGHGGPTPSSEATQPIPVRARKHRAEETQPIPVRVNPDPTPELTTRDITQPIPLRPRNRNTSSSAEHGGENAADSHDGTKVDQ